MHTAFPLKCRKLYALHNTYTHSAVNSISFKLIKKIINIYDENAITPVAKDQKWKPLKDIISTANTWTKVVI